jgi:hypothetical protein
MAGLVPAIYVFIPNSSPSFETVAPRPPQDEGCVSEEVGPGTDPRMKRRVATRPDLHGRLALTTTALTPFQRREQELGSGCASCASPDAEAIHASREHDPAGQTTTFQA